MCRTHTTQHELSAIAPNTFSGCSCSHRSASPTSESAPPAPTSSSGLRARAHTRGCTLLHALPARKRLRPLSPHAYLRTPLARPPAPFARALRARVRTRTGSAPDRTRHPFAFCHTPLRHEFGGDDDPLTCWMTPQDVLTERSRGVGLRAVTSRSIAHGSQHSCRSALQRVSFPWNSQVSNRTQWIW